MARPPTATRNASGRYGRRSRMEQIELRERDEQRMLDEQLGQVAPPDIADGPVQPLADIQTTPFSATRPLGRSRTLSQRPSPSMEPIATWQSFSPESSTSQRQYFTPPESPGQIQALDPSRPAPAYQLPPQSLRADLGLKASDSSAVSMMVTGTTAEAKKKIGRPLGAKDSYVRQGHNSPRKGVQDRRYEKPDGVSDDLWRSYEPRRKRAVVNADEINRTSRGEAALQQCKRCREKNLDDCRFERAGGKTRACGNCMAVGRRCERDG